MLLVKELMNSLMDSEEAFGECGKYYFLLLLNTAKELILHYWIQAITWRRLKLLLSIL